MLEELQARIETAGGARASRYRLLKLILFGPFARNTASETAAHSPQSAMNFLVIVSHRALAGMSAFWDEVEERIARDRQVKCPVTLIIHTLPDVNSHLKAGAPFFCQIINQGILVYADSEPGKDGLPKNIITKPITLVSQRAFEIGFENYQYWKRTSEQFLIVGRLGIQAGTDWRNNTAFQLNQAAESSYRMFLLTVTQYAPPSHNLGKLRSLARAVEPKIDEVWAPLQKPYTRHFELLQRAYVEARYSPTYETHADILVWQANRIEVLIGLADALCREHLDRLKAEHGQQNCMSSRTLVSSGDDR
ncbi:HEPN domain-containing protein [Hyphomonas oceanitis]|uniref:Putative nucleotidyltransferase n=1 Tax=Hyphomonas oceanitis SCH89 TaxID=1280953 RepID=A0A059G252_9PROT|nr:HEPN domain-containing protein [Hyphomonas oceanitis]KCZ99327.1 putative nucleotidyltransferase [Hyphomonas oceanitis SCH89]